MQNALKFFILDSDSLARREKLIFFFIIILTFICFAPSLYNAQFFFDDHGEITALDVIKTPANFFSALFSKTPHDRLALRPLLYFNFAVDWWVSDGNPLYFRLVNLLLHLSNGLWLYLLLLSFFKVENARTRLTLLAVSAIFLIHPFYHSTIIEAARRSSLLSTFFTLGSLYFYKNKKLKLMSTFLILGMFCKEEAVAAVGLIVIDHFLQRHFQKSQAQSVPHYWPYVITPLLLFVTYRAFYLQNTIAQVGSLAWDGREGWGYPLAQIWTSFFYLVSLLIPWPGLIFYPDGLENLNIWWHISIAATTFLGLSFFILFYLKKQESKKYALIFSILAWIILSLPTSTVPLMEVMASRRAYFSSFGFLGAIVAFFQHKKLFLPLLLAFLLLSIPISYHQSGKYQTPAKLWNDVIAHMDNMSPSYPWRGALVYNNQALLAMKEQTPERISRARTLFLQSLKCQANYREGLFNLALLEFVENNHAMAETYLGKIIQFYPNDPLVLSHVQLLRAKMPQKK